MKRKIQRISNFQIFNSLIEKFVLAVWLFIMPMYSYGQCSEPTNANVTTTSTTAAITWASISGAISYDIRIVDAGGVLWNITTAVSSPYMFIGLMPNTSYDICIRSNCSASGISNWGSCLTFTTMASTGCFGVPTPGNTLSSGNPVCSNTSFTLSLQNPTLGTGVTYQWYKDNVAIVAATDATYTTMISTSSDFYCDVTCGGNTGTSNPILITPKVVIPISSSCSESGSVISYSATGGTPPYNVIYKMPSPGTTLTGTPNPGQTYYPIAPYLGTYTITVTDALGCANTVNYNMTQVAPPAIAMNFDGLDDYAQIPNATDLNFGTNNFTVEIWVKMNTTQTSQPTIISSRSNNFPADGFLILTINNRLRIQTNNGTLVFAGNQGPFGPPINDNIWHHVALTRNGTLCTVYLDGVNEGTFASASNIQSPGSLWLGIDSVSGASTFFNGSIDEVRIWNTARTQLEISSNMNCELQPQANLVAYYKFNNGAINANNAGIIGVTDYSGNGHCGTLVNTSLSGTVSNYTEGRVTSCCTTPLPLVEICGNGMDDNCNGQVDELCPSAGITIINYVSPCTGGNVNLSLTGNTTTGVTYQWQTSLDSVSWNNVGGATNNTYNSNCPSTQLYYRSAVSNSAGTVYSSASLVYPCGQLSVQLDSLHAVTCYGANDGSISFTGLGGSGNVSALIFSGGSNNVFPTCCSGESCNSNGNGGNCISTPLPGGGYSCDCGAASSKTKTALKGGKYYVAVKDNIHGCIFFDSVNIPKPNPIVISSTTNNYVVGSNNGSIALTIQGGTPPYSYAWYEDDTIPSLIVGATNGSISGLSCGNYYGKVTDSEGCNDTIQTIVGKFKGGCSSNCCDSGSIFSIPSMFYEDFEFKQTILSELEKKNSCEDSSYWIGMHTFDKCPTLVPLISAFGTHGKFLIVQGSPTVPNKKIWSDSIQVYPNEKYTCSFNISKRLDGFGYDYGDKITLRINGIDYPFNLHLLQFNSTNVLWHYLAVCYQSYVNAKVEIALIDNNTGLEYGIDDIEINKCVQYGIHPPQVENDIFTGCQNESVPVALDVITDHPPVTITWLDSITVTGAIRYLPIGTYTVTLTDSMLYTTQQIIQVLPFTPINFQGNITGTNTLTSSDGSINLIGSGYNGVTNYNWSNGATTQDISNLTIGNYSVSVLDVFGCHSSNTFTVGLKPPPLISTTAGTGIPGYSNNHGLAKFAKLNSPNDVAYDKTKKNEGTLSSYYIADLTNQRIRMVDTNGVITTIAGTGVAGFSGNGGLAKNVQIHDPICIDVDTMGNVYFTEQATHRVRKIDTLGIITTIAGTGVSGSAGNGGLATMAQLSYPSGVAVDLLGNIYITENNKIRKVNTSGVISIIAGNGTAGYGGDGDSAINATVNYPYGIIADKFGNIIFADLNNHKVRKINSDGIITTIAGTGVAGYNYDDTLATLAKLNAPIGIAVDDGGNVFVSELYNHRIRKINTNGIITTIAGTGTYGYSGDGNPAALAQLFNPAGIDLDTLGNLFVADYSNHRIRKIGSIDTPTSTKLNLSLYLQGYYAGNGMMVPAMMNQGVGDDPQQTDSIIVELHESVAPYGVVASTPAMLYTNGNAVANFPPTFGNYYVVIKHRNSMETWSALPIACSAIEIPMEYKTIASKAYGDNLIQVSPGVFAIYSGDINQDENADLLDQSLLESDIANFNFGYFATDLNGDGNVDLLDTPILDVNVNDFIYSNHP